jgi:transcriptional regulator with XRE-family HTH domain
MIHTPWTKNRPDFRLQNTNPSRKSRGTSEKTKRGHCEIQKGAVEVRWGQYPADAGIYQELVSRIENGAANPELDTLGKIAGALGVHPRELLEE